MSKRNVLEADTSPENPGSFSGYSTFLQNNKFNDVDNVRVELENLTTYTLHRRKKPDQKRRVVETTFPNEIAFQGMRR
jgi:hypothetical protein